MPIDLRDQYFGTEIEMTGITRQRAAQVVAEMFGTDYYHRISYDSWCVRDQQGKEWKFSSDGSIITERKVRGLKTCADGEFATEVNTAPKWSVRNCPMEKWESCRKLSGVCAIMGHSSIAPAASMSMWMHPSIRREA